MRNIKIKISNDFISFSLSASSRFVREFPSSIQWILIKEAYISMDFIITSSLLCDGNKSPSTTSFDLLKNVKCRLSLPIRGPRKVENISIDCVKQTNQSKISLHSTTTNEIFWEFFSQLSSLFTLEAVYFALVHSWKNKNELSIVDSVPQVSFLALKPICKDYKHIRSVV